jgi:hypothetical protein
VVQALAAGYFLLFPTCSFCVWYHPLYNGIRTDSSLKFGLFFLMCGFQFLFSCVMAVGFPSNGGCGIWNASKVVDGNKIAGIIQFAAGTAWWDSLLWAPRVTAAPPPFPAVLWIVNCCAQFYLLTKGMGFYRSTGGVR